jgi:hypothetical protein
MRTFSDDPESALYFSRHMARCGCRDEAIHSYGERPPQGFHPYCPERRGSQNGKDGRRNRNTGRRPKPHLTIVWGDSRLCWKEYRFNFNTNGGWRSALPSATRMTFT